MFSDFRSSSTGVFARILGISALVAILFVAACNTTKPAVFGVVTTSAQLPAGQINMAYTQTTLTAANGTSPYTWAVTGGALPAGMSLSSAGVLSGTPTASGSFNFTVTATDAATPTPHTANASLTVAINPALSSVSVGTSPVTGGTGVTGTVTLTGAAVASASVTLSSNNGAATVPASVSVAAGATTANFTITTSAVTTSTPVTITATYGVAKTTTLTVNPPTVQSVVLAASTVTGGNGTTGTVTLTGPAATGGDTVTLGSDNTAAAQVSATVLVPAGQTSVQFNVTTSAVGSSATAHIQASFNSTSQSATLTVVPAPSITSFTSVAAVITAGTSTKLTAVFANGTGSVSGGVGSVTSGVQVTVSPSATTTYTLTVTNTAGTTATASATVTVVPAPTITSFTTAAATITAGTSTKLTATFSNGIGNINNGVGPVTSGQQVTVSPAATTTYTLTVANSATNPATVTATVTVNVVPAPVITSFTASATTIVLGNPTTLTPVFSNGTGIITNNIDSSTITATSGVGAPVSPTTTTTYTLTVSNSATTPATTSAAVTITVDTPPGISSTAATMFTVGTTGSFTVQGTGNPLPSFVEAGPLPSAVTFVDNGNGTATLSGKPATGTDGASPYHFTITASNGVSPNFVQSFTLTVTLVQAPAITTNPTNQTVTVGSTATFTAAASGSPTPTVQWQVSTNGGSTFTNISGATSTTLTLTNVTLTQSSNQYRAVFTNSVNSATTTAATLTVVQPPAITSASSFAFTIGQSSSFTVTTTGVPTASINDGGATLPSGLSFVDVGNGTGTLSGTPSVGDATGNSTITFTAINGATPNATQTFTLTINPPAAIVISPSSTSLPSGTQGTGYNQAVTATGGIPPYTFSLDGTSTALPAGLTLTNSASPNQGVISGTPTAVGTTTNIIVDVTDSDAPPVTQKMTYSLTINPAISCPMTALGHENLLNGTYVALFRAFSDANGPAEAGLVFAANGSGGITGGETDFGSVLNFSGGSYTNPTGTQNLTVSSTGSCYQLDSNDRGLMVLNFGSGNTGTFAIAVRGDGALGRIIEFDDATPALTDTNTRGSALFLKRTISGPFTLASVNGSFALGLVGYNNDNCTSGTSCAGDGGYQRLATVGRFTMNGSGSLSAGVFDVAQVNAGVQQNVDSVSFTGTYTAADANGRGTLMITGSQVPFGGTGTFTINFAYYLIDATHFFLQSTDPSQNVPFFNGEAIAQSGTFSAASLNGNATFSMTGGDVAANSFTTLATGRVTGNGSGSSVSALMDKLSNGSAISTGTSAITGGTFTASSNGMGVLTIGSGGSAQAFSVAMFGANSGFMIEGTQAAPGTNIMAGMFQTQTAPGGGFAASTLSGLFTESNPNPSVTSSSLEVGTVTFTAGSPNTISGNSDKSNGLGCGSNCLQLNKSISGDYTVDTNGRVTITSGGPVGWITNTSHAVLMNSGSDGLTIELDH